MSHFKDIDEKIKIYGQEINALKKGIFKLSNCNNYNNYYYGNNNFINQDKFISNLILLNLHLFKNLL